MSTYQPGYVPDDQKAMAEFLRQEFIGIKQALEQGADALYLTTLYKSPAKLREGMLILADGTQFNPGSGGGVYVYRAGAFRFLG